MRLKAFIVIGSLAWLLAVARPHAQVISSQQVSAQSSGGGCTAVANSCGSFQIASAQSLTLQVSGTFTGTLTFESTSDGTNWNTVSVMRLSDGAPVTTATALGQFSFTNSGVLQIRVRATAWTSGTAKITATRGTAIARVFNPVLPGVSGM